MGECVDLSQITISAGHAPSPALRQPHGHRAWLHHVLSPGRFAAGFAAARRRVRALRPCGGQPTRTVD